MNATKPDDKVCLPAWFFYWKMTMAFMLGVCVGVASALMAVSK